MGREKAKQPKRIAEKLRQVRLALEMSQDEMARALERQEVKVYKAYISLYEAGERVPTLLITLAYARIAGVPVETIIDDKLDLPK
ncbi:MAG: helix-turn-helix domain-containing protein [Pyrinomonadaceae bacterium]